MNCSIPRLRCIATLTILLSAPVRGVHPVTKSTETLVLTNVTVIDGNGGQPKPGMTVVIAGERIADVYPAGKKRLPAGATVKNLTGHYVIPGLIDSHYHFMLGMRSKEQEAALRRFAFLGGVTAVRDMAAMRLPWRNWRRRPPTRPWSRREFISRP